jgi:2-oxoglutarate ferredoxin oxidoreductase subunit delta
MNQVTFRQERCKGCGLCVQACPKGIIRLSGAINGQAYHYAEVAEMEKCIGCGFCALMCPDVAIKVEKEVGEK